MDLPEETIDDLLKRLRRVEGQVGGVQQMLSEGRECRDVVTLISAASKAWEQTGFKLVAYCLSDFSTDPWRAHKAGSALADVRQKLVTHAGPDHGPQTNMERWS